jgi:hypothetical protein
MVTSDLPENNCNMTELKAVYTCVCLRTSSCTCVRFCTSTAWRVNLQDVCQIMEKWKIGKENRFDTVLCEFIPLTSNSNQQEDIVSQVQSNIYEEP